MKLIEKKQKGRDKNYVLSISRKEFRLLAASLNAVDNASSVEGWPAWFPSLNRRS